MSADAEDGWDKSRSAAGDHNPWLIAGIISIATFMEVLDTSIANVSLRYIAGSLAASSEESTWVITSYLVANATVLPISGWLSGVVGRKRFYMFSVALFTLSSLACGLAPNLPTLIVARVFQGIGGGGLAPSEQSMLADTFPPSKRAKAFAIYGITVIVAPALGPTIGGWISDNISWHWIFFLNVPMGLASLLLVQIFVDEPRMIVEERKEHIRNGIRIDWIGFILVALFLGCLEVVLDKGQEDDWFGSNFIATFAVVSGVSFALFIPWELTRKDPIVDLRLLGHRQFAASCAVMLAMGAVIFSTTQVIPQLLQESFSYDATTAGLALMPGGLCALVTVVIAGRLSGAVQPKYLMIGGFAMIAIAMYRLTGLTPQVSFGWIALERSLQMAAMPFLFIPVTAVSYIGLPPDKSGEASSLINVARNLGGSIGVATTQTLLARREQFHQTRLAEHISPTSQAYLAAIKQATANFMSHGTGTVDAQRRAVALIGQTITSQVAILSYIDVFFALGVLALCMMPIPLLLKSTTGSRKPAAG
jgi:MFS transporter, DHA2 family, multidrug resistance protein